MLTRQAYTNANAVSNANARYFFWNFVWNSGLWKISPANRSCSQQHSSTVELVDHSHDGRRCLFHARRRSVLFVTSISRGFVVCNSFMNTGRAQKSGATDSWPSFCQILTDFKTFFTVRFPSKFAIKLIFKIPPHFVLLLHYLVKHLCQQNKPLTTNCKVV